MLVKNEKNPVFFAQNDVSCSLYCDAHFHYAVCKSKDCEPDLNVSWPSLSCAHSIEEWKIQEEAALPVKKAFGLHPQACTDKDFDLNKNADFLEGLLKKRKAFLLEKSLEGDKAAFFDGKHISAIGEAGFDYFTQDFKEKKALQEEMWNIQLELAEEYNMPMVIHCRKANEKLFEYACRLKKLPAVLFHSFMGSPVEASSLIKRGITCCFSFGKQMLNGNKKVIDCVRLLPVENLLLETDAPFQTLKGEAFTRAGEIERVYYAAAKIRGISLDELIPLMKRNFTDFP